MHGHPEAGLAGPASLPRLVWLLVKPRAHLGFPMQVLFTARIAPYSSTLLDGTASRLKQVLIPITSIASSQSRVLSTTFPRVRPTTTSPRASATTTTPTASATTTGSGL
ncbi:hypothetical protein FA10DRAFT_201079 [Acaromyces ingoldii]|uniref:Uncharacterized protein n=1 Tax=Acaromyces ingoldii TaxID=215250 RepID=A0A316YAI0_9BASI|nr:hypothetical protein FA10DRAFT_201079 [Acaromyces ingoldii]PWN86840.1 hypothetical protein FA10DRAFT_201079 [Acaromyces ingoldii]